MKVLIANPPWVLGGIRAGSRWAHGSDVKDSKSYVVFPSFLASAATVLHNEKKHKVKVIDSLAIGHSRKKFFSEVKKFQPDVIVIETSTASIQNDIEIINKIKNFNKCKTIFMGPHVISRPEDALDNGIDFCINGEYEYPLRDLINALDKGKLPKRGISYKVNGKIKTLPRHAPILNINDLPLPAFELFEMDHYNTPFSGAAQNIDIMTSRGCPFRCTYCLWPQVLYDTRTVRFRNPTSVVDEIEILLNNYNKKGIYFNDDTFTLNKNHVLGLCKEIKRRKINIKWACFGHVIPINNMPEILKPMKDAGCCLIKIGIESGSQKILDNMNKGTTIKKIEEAVKLIKKSGIKVHGSFVFGLPGETKETAKQTIAFAKKLKLHSLVFSIATPYPGTAFFNTVSKNKWLKTKDWSHYDGECNAVARTATLSTNEIEKIFEYANANYVLNLIKNPAYILSFLKNAYISNGFLGFIEVSTNRIPWYIKKIQKNFSTKRFVEQ